MGGDTKLIEYANWMRLYGTVFVILVSSSITGPLRTLKSGAVYVCGVCVCCEHASETLD